MLTSSSIQCFIVVVIGAASVSSVPVQPAVEPARVSRDLDKIDGLRTRLLRLQQQINTLEPTEQPDSVKAFEGERERGVPNKDADNDDASKELQAMKGTEGQMTSQRQQQVQTLSKKLDDGRNKDLHTLAETLNQLLRQTISEEERRHPNTAGEFLGDNYKGTLAPKKSDTDDDGLDSARIGKIYNMLLKMYSEELAAGGDGEQEKSADRSYRNRGLPSIDPRTRIQIVHTDEGSFGDFLDDTNVRRPAAADVLHTASNTRGAVLSAIEDRLLKDVQEAKEMGFSVEDLIRDIQNKAQQIKEQKLHRIEQELDELTERSL